MDESLQKVQQRTVRLTVDLPIEVVVWIDGLKSQLGFASRGQAMTALLMELIPESQQKDMCKCAGADER